MRGNPNPLNPNHDFEWTPERVAELTRLYMAGGKTKEMAKALGCTKNSLIGKANRLGLCTPKIKKPARTARLDAPATGLCQWPHGHPRDKDFHFCAKPVKADKPYCPRHCRKAYRPDRKAETRNSKSPFVWRS